MAKPDNPGAYSPGDLRRNESLDALDAIGPDTCYGCGAQMGQPHSPLCRIYLRGDQAWAKSESSKSDMGGKYVEHHMVSEPGKRGWRKSSAE